MSNIPYETRWPDLKDLFRNKVGDIMYCEVFEKDSRSLGVAAIEFKTIDDAERAVQVMHQYELGGRKISCRIDNEGYKTRQAKEQALDHHHHHHSHHHSSSNKQSSSSSNHSNNNNNNNNDNSNSQQSAASVLALALASLGSNSQNNNLLSSLFGLVGGGGGGGSVVGGGSGSNLGIQSLFGGANPTSAQTNLLNQYAAQLKVDGPVTNRIFIASLDYKVDEHKIEEVFNMSGKVQNVSLFKDRDGKSRGMAVVEYDTPFEALNAVAMFNNQTLMERQMTVRFDTKPPRDDEIKSSSSSSTSKLPSGLKSIGTGISIPMLGSNGGNSNGMGPLGAMGALGQTADLSALSNFGINLNGNATSLMSKFYSIKYRL